MRARARIVGRRAVWLGAALLALTAAGSASAQETAALAGRTLDLEGVPIAAVTVRLESGAATRVVVSDSAGWYRAAGLPPGEYSIAATRLGHEPASGRVLLRGGETGRLDLTLPTTTVLLEGVVVDAPRDADRERARFESEAGVTARVIRGETLKSLPGLAEADVLRAVEVLPGVVTTSDFSSAFNVRGGSADQNLILLDGFPIFNPFHLGGLFSVFNSDAIARAELLAGGFGAEYGGRVSSVLSVETLSGGGDEGLQVDGGISMLATRVQVRSDLPASASAALGVRSGSWLVSARRSYFDQLLRPFVDFPYYLTDLQAHGELGLAGGGSLSFTAYGGADVLDLSDFEVPGEDSTGVLRVRWNWGNRLSGVRWRQPLGGRWTSDVRVGHSRFADRLRFVDFEGARFTSRIAQTSARADLSRVFSGGGLKLGGAAERLSYDNLAEAGGTPFYSAADHGTLLGLYGSLSMQPDDRWLIEPGLRLDAWRATGDDFVAVSPRFAVKRFLGVDRDAAAKLALGRYTQFLHSLRDESLPVSNDTWIVAGRGTPVLVSDQIQVGVEKYWGEAWSASLEGYYRRFDGVTEFNLADDPNDPLDDMLEGSGTSVGADLLVRRNRGRLTGWTTLSLLRAERTLPDLNTQGWEDLPPEVTFPPVFDRRVDVDVVLEYQAPHEIQVGLRWNFGSPIPYTRPVAQYFAWRYSPLRRQYEPLDQPGDGPPVFVRLGDRNSERYPPYHRLDLTLRRTFERSWGNWTPYVQVLNAYNRKNVLWYFFKYDRTPPTRSGLSMFPVLPAVGVEMSF